MWSMSRGTTRTLRKGCFLGDQGETLSLILPYGFILMGLEAFKSPPLERNTQSWGESSYPRTTTMNFVTSGQLIAEQG